MMTNQSVKTSPKVMEKEKRHEKKNNSGATSIDSKSPKYRGSSRSRFLDDEEDEDDDEEQGDLDEEEEKAAKEKKKKSKRLKSLDIMMSEKMKAIEERASSMSPHRRRQKHGEAGAINSLMRYAAHLKRKEASKADQEISNADSNSMRAEVSKITGRKRLRLANSLDAHRRRRDLTRQLEIDEKKSNSNLFKEE